MTRFLLCSLLMVTLVSASLAQPALYPMVGKIVGTGINQVTRSRTYRISTDTKIYELDCGKHALFSGTPPECGGEKKLQIGDELHFRIEKDKAYIPVAPSVESSGEQKLRILREELKPGKPETPAAGAGK